jgi:hypothetical protein
MGFRTGSYAKIWKIDRKEKYSDVQLSISKKNKQTDQYETEFSSTVRFIASANDDLRNITEGDRIKLGDCDVTNSFDKETKIGYTNYKLFSFERVDSAQTNNSTPSQCTDSTNKGHANTKIETDEDTGLPFWGIK